MDKIIVLKHSGMSYIQAPTYGPQPSLVNGEIPQACLGNENWRMVAGDVVRIVNVRKGSPPVVRWLLADKYDGIVDLPSELPAGATPYDRDACDCKPYDAEECRFDPGFYRAEYGDAPEVVTPMEFEVFDVSCEPFDLPPWVKPDFPHSLKEYPWAWHKFPCSVTAAHVFGEALERVTGIVNKTPHLFFSQHYPSIGHVVVSENIAVPFESKYTQRYDAKIGRKKTETRTRVVEERNRAVVVLDLSMEGSIYGDLNTRVIVHGVQGENFENLVAKKDAYIERIAAMLSPEAREVCPCCKGIGIIKREIPS